MCLGPGSKWRDSEAVKIIALITFRTFVGDWLRPWGCVKEFVSRIPKKNEQDQNTAVLFTVNWIIPYSPGIFDVSHATV